MEQTHNSPDAENGPASSVPSWMGKKVARFKLIGLLGRGAMGKVFRAEDTTLHRQVALKTLPRLFKTTTHTITADQLIREARSAAAIEHPHVVQIYEAGESNGVFYIAMELLEGGTIHSLVKGAGPLDPVRACQIAAEAAEALDYAHQLGIIHRDIKPSNLMLTRSGRCKVVDFGLARVEDANGKFVPLGETVGTAYFLAPEVIGGAQATAKSDIYSLAATLYMLLTGDAPFGGDSKAEVLTKHLSAPLPNLLEVRPDIPESLVKVIHRAMAKRPEDRFESAGNFAKALRVHTIPVGNMSGSFMPLPAVSSVMQPATPAPVSTGWWTKTHTLVAAAVGVVVIVGIAVAASLKHSAPPAGPNLQPTHDKLAVTAAPTPIEKPLPAGDATVAAAPAMAAGTVDAADSATLLSIADGKSADHRDKHVVVEGIPSAVGPSSSGKVFRIEFADRDGGDGFLAVYFPGSNMFARMESKFGKNASGLLHQRVRIKGDVEIYQSRPEVRINNPEQIEILK